MMEMQVMDETILDNIYLLHIYKTEMINKESLQ